jgi:Class II Aldolase and Adducin N-terminal domain
VALTAGEECIAPAARQDVQAIVHAHPAYCTAHAITGKDIPAVHYMIAAAGGSTVRCAPYATFGTDELSEAAVKALEGRLACLLANHGLIASSFFHPVGHVDFPNWVQKKLQEGWQIWRECTTTV